MIKKIINKYKNAFENLEVKNINSLLNLVDDNVEVKKLTPPTL